LEGTKAAATILYSDPQHVSRFDIIKIGENLTFNYNKRNQIAIGDAFYNV
jgi:hypothetical protein